MRINATVAHGYQVLSIAENMGMNSDLGPLLKAVDEHVAEGRIRIALRFSATSFLSTRAIAILVQCVEHVTEKGGRLAILSPNPDIVHCLQVTKLEDLFEVVEREEELGRAAQAK
jgi:anti-anti-sigma factor